MQKWEYCAITDVSSGVEGDAMVNAEVPSVNGEPAGAVTYFTSGGGRTTPIENGATRLAQVIAQLGSDGWEMVGCGNVSEDFHTLYFKRPLSY